MTQNMAHHLQKALQRGEGWSESAPDSADCRRCSQNSYVIALRPLKRFGRIWHVCPKCVKEMQAELKAGEPLATIWKFAEEIMSEENERTVTQFVAELAQRWPGENPDTIRDKVYKWIRAGLVPHRREPNEEGIIVVTADPSTFEPPFPFGPGPTPEGEGVRVTVAAKQLGLSRAAVYNRLRKAGIAGGRVPEELFDEWVRAGK